MVLTSGTQPTVPILIVTFRNVPDVLACIAAIGRMLPDPHREVFVCENGGPDAFDRLVCALIAADGPCDRQAPDDAGGASSPSLARPSLASPRLIRVAHVRLRGVAGERTISVRIGCAAENLGYAAGVNAWLEPLLAGEVRRDWPGAWVLNPDTEPAPDALLQLMRAAQTHHHGMVGSRLSSPQRPDLVHCYGLAWRKIRAATMSVGMHSPVDRAVPPGYLDRRLGAPSGASMYVTQACLQRIGLMDERYFLYFEDLDWGLRASRAGGVGYAHGSIVTHVGGTTIGTSSSRRDQSPFAVYLDYRNRLLFVRHHFPRWLLWTALVAAAELTVYVAILRPANAIAAARGIAAGLRGQTGRPDALLNAHVARRER
jgi:GT2 family glycosyltransferase